ncbi:MAG: anthranilate phosphoribosyltransferase [Pseudolysinimonas sp.]|uniref:anthranilate phosphoribosyltransferase n=1 Tax=Pseudolysinimonas sp. TaxID=2680009 RepID=UPI0032658658
MPTELTWPALLTQLLAGADLKIAEASWAMEEVMAGRATPAQLAGFLVALRGKGETVDEIVGFRDAVLAHALPLPVDPMAVDLAGTGGDRMGTVNVSTMASIVAAAAGARVIKHGNRAASSASGSSDVLAALGLDLTISPERVAEVLDEVGITFVYATLFHPGFKHAGAVRGELGIPTVFNFLGPLCNPARPEASSVGVAALDKVPLIVGVFRTRGAAALVFRGDDGLDELSTTGHSHLWEVSRGEVREHDIDPGDFGLRRATIEELRGGDAERNAAIARATFAGESGPVRDIVLLNSAAALVAWELARDPGEQERDIRERFTEKIALASEAIDSGAATAKLDALVAATRK